jgi:hypothetical protein
MVGQLAAISSRVVARDRVGGLRPTPRAAMPPTVGAGRRLWKAISTRTSTCPTTCTAERMEHYLDPQLADKLAAELAGRAVVRTVRRFRL